MKLTPLHEFVVTQLEGSPREDWHEIAKRAGVPFKTVQKIGHRTTKSPGVDKIEKLAAYFRQSKKSTRSTELRA